MKTQTPVLILARIAFKADPRKVCYQCLSSDGSTVYTTCLFNGRRTSCTCPARTLDCKHAKAAEAREAERAASKPVATVKIDGHLAEVVATPAGDIVTTPVIEDDFSDLIMPDYAEELERVAASQPAHADEYDALVRDGLIDPTVGGSERQPAPAVEDNFSDLIETDYMEQVARDLARLPKPAPVVEPTTPAIEAEARQAEHEDMKRKTDAVLNNSRGIVAAHQRRTIGTRGSLGTSRPFSILR